MVARAGELAEIGFTVHPHQLGHACGYYLASKGQDTRAIQSYMGHRNIQHTVSSERLMGDAKTWTDSVSIIPIEAHGKRPLIPWTEYQRRRATREEREEWKKKFPGCNWGLVTGKVSGLVALDFDGEEGLALRKEKNVYGPIPTNLTGKGCHCLFQHPEREIRNGTRLLPGLDVRGDGGYVVIPPSIHPSGKKYEWQIPPWMVSELPELPDWVWRLLEKAGSTPGAPAVSTEPDGLPPGVGKGARNQTTASHAGRYLALPPHGKGLSPEEAATILVAWNRKNTPPLPEEEIRRTVFSIARREREKGPTIDLIDSSELATLAPRTEEKGKYVNYHPAGLGKSGHFPNLEETENEHE